MTIVKDLNHLFRRFRQYEAESDWINLVMEAAPQSALLTVTGDRLELRATGHPDIVGPLSVDTMTAAAFEAVLRSKEPVTALRTQREVGPELTCLGKLGHLFPIFNANRVVAVLFAPAEGADVDRLDLVANMASSALERRANPGITIASAAKAEPRLSSWASMPPAQRDLHSRAARFARTAVAEMQLLKPAVCRAALENGNLYVTLGSEIDKARATFKKQFMINPSMADYLHRELVSSILCGDAKKLGADYPGELA